MSDRYEELTEWFSQPLPERFILKLLLIRLTKVEICHLNRSYLRHLLFSWVVVERTITSGKEQQYEPLQLIGSCSARAKQRQRWWEQPQQCWGWEWWSREQRWLNSSPAGNGDEDQPILRLRCCVVYRHRHHGDVLSHGGNHQLIYDLIKRRLH